MSPQELESTAQALVAPGKGILAADESTATIGKRLASINVESSEDTRRSYRQLLFTTGGAGEFISGVILYDETIRQSTSDGQKFVDVMVANGMIPGIKVDTGAKPLSGAPDEKVTEGLDGLRDRLNEYRELGARFAKWRAVITIGDSIPSSHCILANAQALTRYASLCQEAGIVPIVEPEVLMDGNHTIERCFSVTETTLHTVFRTLFEHDVLLEGILLKPNMVISGTKCPRQAGVEEVASETLRCLRRVVPAAVPGVVFLSGGQSDEDATAHLNAMNTMCEAPPWQLSFSYGRALQAPPLKTWSGKVENIAAAQSAFYKRAKLNGAARDGRYNSSMEAEKPAA
jgi:fructose-bisphosphate aldolase class I